MFQQFYSGQLPISWVKGSLAICLLVFEPTGVRSSVQTKGRGTSLWHRTCVCVCSCACAHMSGLVFPAPRLCTILNSLASLTTALSMAGTHISAVGGLLGDGSPYRAQGAPWEMVSIHLVFPLCGAAGLSRQSCGTRRGGGVG